MNRNEFNKRIEEILAADNRYAVEAYEFISEAVSYTTEKHINDGQKRHISGQELLEGIGEFAKRQFGPLAGEVLEHWGIKDSVSVGNVVFNMAEYDLLATSEDDSIEDFKGELNFVERLQKPFKPAEKQKITPPIIA